MRPILAALVLTAAVAGAPQKASAQSPYSYPWCAKLYVRGTPTSCYYASRQLCMETVSGIGCYCFQNPAYRGAAVASPRYVPVSPRRHRYRRY
jgi:Protein of unknown function (DUF3551)